MLVAVLIAHIVSFADSISTAQLELEDLLLGFLVDWIRKSVVTLCEFLRLDQVLVIVSTILCILSSCMTGSFHFLLRATNGSTTFLVN